MRLFRRKKKDEEYEPAYKDEQGWHIPALGIVMPEMGVKIRASEKDGVRTEFEQGVDINPDIKDELEQRIAEDLNRKAWQERHPNSAPWEEDTGSSSSGTTEGDQPSST